MIKPALQSLGFPRDWIFPVVAICFFTLHHWLCHLHQPLNSPEINPLVKQCQAAGQLGRVMSQPLDYCGIQASGPGTGEVEQETQQVLLHSRAQELMGKLRSLTAPTEQFERDSLSSVCGRQCKGHGGFTQVAPHLDREQRTRTSLYSGDRMQWEHAGDKNKQW